MPRVPIDEMHRTGEGGSQFPKLKLVKGEKARFLVLEQPMMEWAHSLRAPVIENGKVQVTKEGKTDMGFVGQPFCLGHADVLDDKGVDPANCPACAEARNNPDFKPQRRYAVNVVRYGLKHGTWDPVPGPSLEIVIWTFTARMYDELLDIKRKLADMAGTETCDLRQSDITLECEVQQFQRHKMSFQPKAAWKLFENGGQAVARAWQEPGNRATDDQLRDACGRESSRAQILEDVQLCVNRQRQAERIGLGDLDPVGNVATGSLDQGMDDLLGSRAPAANGQAAADPLALENPGAGGLGEFGDPLAAVQEARAEVQRDLAAMSDPFAGIEPQQTGAAAGASTAPIAGVPAAASGQQAAAATSDPLAAAPAAAASSSWEDLLDL